jgi:hypothetical protein
MADRVVRASAMEALGTFAGACFQARERIRRVNILR